MKNAEKILHTFLADEHSIVLFWGREDGWQVLSQTESLIDPAYYTKQGIFGLAELVAEKDRSCFEHYLTDVKEKMEGAAIRTITTKGKHETAFLFCVPDCPAYYKISRYMEDSENGAEGILFRIEPLEPEESYRYRLARIITNDKNPESFTIEVGKLFRQNPDQEYAFIQFDVAGFKLINQQFGEAFGDELLSYFIKTLKLVCDETQLYVRLTADVFMILTPYEGREQIIAFIDRVRELLEGYRGVDYRLIFGICVIQDKSKNIRIYGDGAAFARQSIKKSALKYYAFFEEKMKTNALDRKWIEDHMEKALAANEFVMYLQPKYHIVDEQMVGAEALVRWIHPEKGLIPPAKFISLFEENGFIIKLDHFMWEEACKCIAKWQQEGRAPVYISVNVSRRHMQNEEYLEVLEKLVEKYQIDKKYLELEITETLDDELVARGLELLKEHGFTLLMDDFGSGYSSLNTLKDTQFDVIKIDREFLKDFIETDRGQSIVRHTISMVRDIGLGVVAEGVENLEQAKFINACGCDVAQGFYYAKPMPVSDFERRAESGFQMSVK